MSDPIKEDRTRVCWLEAVVGVGTWDKLWVEAEK